MEANTSKNQTYIETFREWADKHASEFQEYEGESWEENVWTAYMQPETNGDRDIVSFSEDRNGELTANIGNTVGSLKVVKLATGLVSDSRINNTGEQSQQEIKIRPVSKVDTRDEISQYSQNDGHCLVIGSFDVDHSRGVDHDVADIQFVIDPT